MCASLILQLGCNVVGTMRTHVHCVAVEARVSIITRASVTMCRIALRICLMTDGKARAFKFAGALWAHARDVRHCPPHTHTHAHVLQVFRAREQLQHYSSICCSINVLHSDPNRSITLAQPVSHNGVMVSGWVYAQQLVGQLRQRSTCQCNFVLLGLTKITFSIYITILKTK